LSWFPFFGYYIFLNFIHCVLDQNRVLEERIFHEKHWNIVTVEDSDVDDETVRELIDHSYELVYKSLTKKQREELR